MWMEYKKAPNQMMAEMWKELLEAEGLPCRILPEGDVLNNWSEVSRWRVLVPRGREHVADEILRKV